MWFYSQQPFQNTLIAAPDGLLGVAALNVLCLLSFAGLAQAQNPANALTSPVPAEERTLPPAVHTATNEHEGSLMLGFDSRPCDASLEGFIRYNSAERNVQVCNGMVWANWGE